MHTVPLDIQAPPAAPPHTPRRAADRCPTAIALHPAADGLIARVRLPGGRLAPAQARVLAAWAVGNERIELTVRGNLQIRGLVAEQAAPLAAALHAAGLLPSEPHDQARTIVASPVAGRIPGAAPVDGLVAAIDAAICDAPELAALSGRFLTAVDDGTGLVDIASADLAVVVHEPGGISAGSVVDGPQASVFVAGVRAGQAAVADVPAALVAAARAFLAQAAGAAWRIRELPDGGAAVRGAVEGSPLSRGAGRAGGSPEPPSPRDGLRREAAALPGLGAGVQVDGRSFVRVSTVLGRMTASQLEVAAAAAETAGTDLRIAGDRSITLVDLAPRHVQPTIEALQAAGFVVEPASTALGLTVCAGLGCEKAHADVRAAARVRLGTRRPGAPDEHVVGCERRCGSHRSATTFVATEQESPEALAERIRRAALETHR